MVSLDKDTCKCQKKKEHWKTFALPETERISKMRKDQFRVSSFSGLFIIALKTKGRIQI